MRGPLAPDFRAEWRVGLVASSDQPDSVTSVESALLDLARIAAQEAIREAVSRIIHTRAGKAKKDKRISESIERVVASTDQEAFALHVRDAHHWASVIQVQGMPRPVATNDASVPLDLAQVPRRFRREGDDTRPMEESYLLESDDDFMVLGDPGAGKTTTLKRFTLSLFAERPGGDDQCFPEVIVCREVDWTTTDLASEILRRAGMNLAVVAREVAGFDALELAAALLDDLHAVVVIDGLDEIADTSSRGNVLDAISRLHRRCQTARIMCSCRSGEAPHIEGFAVAELLPLSPEQIHEIVALRSSSADHFLSLVSKSGVSELMDRPLFLNQLLTVYETTGSLPERPVDLYRQLVRLLLHEWDEQRRVGRRSVYANFDSAAKQEFLAEVAFYLTERGRVTFTESELIEVYGVLADQFGLPKNQAQRVVREIESHVGIVTEIPYGFQFSHLTLQEYLCAESIVRQGMNDGVAEYVRRYPEVVAVAVALSSRPSHWLAECVRRAKSFEAPQHADAFVTRLALERPRLTASVEVGEAILKLANQANAADLTGWRRFAEMPAVSASIAMMRDAYHFDRSGTVVRWSRKVHGDDRTRRRVESGRLPVALFDMLSGARPSP